MKAFVTIVAFCVLIAVAFGEESNSVSDDKFCYKGVTDACDSKGSKGSKDVSPICNSRFGAMAGDLTQNNILQKLQKYVNAHITRSYEYLLMATHYANFLMNRPGFEKLFRDLSDQKWAAAQELIEYIAKRGGEMDFEKYDDFGVDNGATRQYELYELQSIAKALDIEKKLTEDANVIHREALHNKEAVHDSDLAHYIEEAFAEKQAETIRKLAGYSTDLTGLLGTNGGKDSPLALHLFDEYLLKQ